MPIALPLPTRVSQQSTSSHTYRVITSELGNGYRSYAADGVNIKRSKWNLVYTNLTESEKNTIVAALDTVGAHDYMNWTQFGDTVSKKWQMTNEGYTITAKSGSHYDITLTIEQVFR